MSNRLISIGMVALLVISGFLGFITFESDVVRAGTTHYVGGSGPGNYSKIQDAINASMDGDTVFVYNGTYYENVDITQTISLIGENKDTTIIDGSSIGNVVTVNANRVKITGFTITNSSTGYDDHAGILIKSDYTIIHNNNISSNWIGIFLKSSNYTEISGNILLDNRYGVRLGYYESPLSAHFANWNMITGNTILNNKYGVSLEWYAEGNNITQNTFLNNNWSVSSFHGPRGTRITDNIMFSNQGGISISDSFGYIKNNYISGKGKNDGISLGISGSHEAVGADIINNTITNFSQGIHLSGDEGGDIISGNNISLNKNWGIKLFYSPGGKKIYSNNISSNGEGGIYLEYYSYSNEVKNNLIKYNFGPGIKLKSSSLNIISLNNISNNTYGIYSNSSSHNRIFHNFIDNNQIQAYDDGNNNFWDDGYPSGGNYWSDYVGVDLFSGPNQTQNGRDGIGDTPYEIDTDSLDNYPLVENINRSKPSPPRDLKARAGDGYVNLTWNAPELDSGFPIINYTIYRDGKFLIKIGNITYYNDTNVSSGIIYYYRITATNIFGEGPFSNQVNATFTSSPTYISPIDIKPLKEITYPWLWMMYVFLLGIILLGVFVEIRRRKKRE